ncbi:response regulator [Rhizobium sp. CG5]|uniref:response regulator transcription factor n=1 Tax=Rhizobium sp. CG5 TaxID=2726076 RepID=UPI002033D5A6|nr:response regulator [Rhizobium sp. CG5]MCM2475444.1 response regulator [Rhizobium sp. CG5]
MPSPRNVHIAVIDDDDSFRAATQLLVRSLGFDVAGYESAESFLDRCSDRNADCIISDINMPGMTGIELKQRLNEEGVDVPVIFVSAQTDPTLPRRVIECGGLVLLQKPFHGQNLIDAIHHAIGDLSQD